MADMNVQLAKLLDRLTTEGKADLITRLGASDSDGGPHAEHTLNNTSLLLESLAAFYGESKSEFFPTAITTAIRERLMQAESIFAGLPIADEPIPADSASGLLKLLEDLYVYCLQYGLIAYGFSGKIAQKQVELIRLAQQQTEAAAHKMLVALKSQESELSTKLETFAKSLAGSEADCKAKISEQLSALQPLIDGVAALLAAGRTDSTEIKTIMNAVKDHAAAVEKVRADLDAAATAATAEFISHKTTADAEIAAIQTVGKSLQALGSDAKAQLKDVTDARATIKIQMTEITAFYGEIEKYRLQMTDTGKTAQSDLAELRQHSEEMVEGLRDRTENVVGTNESLIGQIKDHLRKAIGASLFTAFDTRRRHITFASWVWAGLLLASVGGALWFTAWFAIKFAESMKDNPSSLQWTVVYARLVIAAPLAFLIAFTAKRYSSERRAEEEWAFKSAISISLEPFRDLLARMQEKGQQTALVESLVSEIFDNPSKRLYAVALAKESKDEPNIFGLLKDVLEKVPKAN